MNRNQDSLGKLRKQARLTEATYPVEFKGNKNLATHLEKIFYGTLISSSDCPGT